MKKAAIEIKNISKFFAAGDQKTQVLSDINLEINFDELTMLVGPSGCGKTTLLSIITGILSPSAGEVIINKTSITSLADREKVNFRCKNLGFIFQQYNLLSSLSAKENAAIPLIAAGMKFEEAVEIAAKTLAKIGMENYLDKLPSQLSGGQQQRVSIARALVHNPSIIVCDEPTAALDAKTGRLVMEILREIALQENRAVIVVTHDNRIFDFANRIIEMEDGKISNADL